MSLQAVVKKDILDVRRAKLVWGVGLLYTLFAGLSFWGIGSSSDTDIYNALFSMAGIGVLIIPLVALVAAYLSVAGERETGNLKFLLSYPNSRRDVVIGKFIARSAIVVAAIIFAFVVGLGMAFYYFPSVELPNYVGFVGLTLVYALSYVAIAVGISAATSTRSRAMGAAIGSWFVLNVFWNFLPIQPATVIEFVADKLGTSVSQNFKDLVWVLSPTGSYFNSLSLVFPDRINGAQGGGGVGDPFYLQPEFMFVILALWIVVPLALGYWRFERADLG
ncbi:ABC transporter permease [Haloarchaeobius sp. FL176]|uniref:ABC transporter permease n=1 Tax=Haloarchaeobius sp. FL176 TaxID=2967129 RepID=UPI00214963B3|nr:ABC transporter permease [Haloarchaeobius sp. FL176]